jgi:hypothetical protein
MKYDLKAIFGKYAGQTLKDPNRLSCDIDSTAAAMQKTAADYGFKLSLKFPHTTMTTGAGKHQVDIDVEKNKAGKFVVTNRINWG